MATRQQWRERMGQRMRSLIRQAEAQGWTVTATKKSHVQFRAPWGRAVFASGAGRQLDQHIARTENRLRDAGLVIDGIAPTNGEHHDGL